MTRRRHFGAGISAFHVQSAVLLVIDDDQSEQSIDWSVGELKKEKNASKKMIPSLTDSRTMKRTPTTQSCVTEMRRDSWLISATRWLLRLL